MIVRYDGNAVGSVNPDVTRQFRIKFVDPAYESFSMSQYNEAGWSTFFSIASGRGASNDYFWLEPVGNFGNETAPVWGAVLYAIVY